MPRGQLEETKNTIRIALREDKDYDSFRTIRLTSGVKLLLGIEDGESEGVTLIFDKNKFTKEQAKDWFDSHKSEFNEKFKKALELETEKSELFGRLIDDVMVVDNFKHDSDKIRSLLEENTKMTGETREMVKKIFETMSHHDDKEEMSEELEEEEGETTLNIIKKELERRNQDNI